MAKTWGAKRLEQREGRASPRAVRCFKWPPRLNLWLQVSVRHLSHIESANTEWAARVYAGRTWRVLRGKGIHKLMDKGTHT